MLKNMLRTTHFKILHERVTEMKIAEFANSVDLDEYAHNEPTLFGI